VEEGWFWRGERVEVERIEEVRQQIPFGNDSQKSKCKCNSDSRFPSGMTARKASASATATADSLRE
jgi:hypothetical protein